MPRVFLDVDSRTLPVPTTRMSGADPFKLHRQTAKYGKFNSVDANDRGEPRLGWRAGTSKRSGIVRTKNCWLLLLVGYWSATVCVHKFRRKRHPPESMLVHE